MFISFSWVSNVLILEVFSGEQVPGIAVSDRLVDCLVFLDNLAHLLFEEVIKAGVLFDDELFDGSGRAEVRRAVNAYLLPTHRLEMAGFRVHSSHGELKSVTQVELLVDVRQQPVPLVRPKIDADDEVQLLDKSGLHQVVQAVDVFLAHRQRGNRHLWRDGVVL